MSMFQSPIKKTEEEKKKKKISSAVRDWKTRRTPKKCPDKFIFESGLGGEYEIWLQVLATMLELCPKKPSPPEYDPKYPERCTKIDELEPLFSSDLDQTMRDVAFIPRRDLHEKAREIIEGMIQTWQLRPTESLLECAKESGNRPLTEWLEKNIPQ